ncbi:MAG: NAD-dependent malic enzyme, partial [Dehalococcoidia bacterium]|nr:NAD-dependent malic enzyme [Dehalococcoidia bacterium]
MAGRTPGVAYSITVRGEYPNEPGMLGKITSAIGLAGGSAQGVDVVQTSKGKMVRDFTVNTSGQDHAARVVEAIKGVEEVKVRSVSDQTFLLHVGGKIEMRSRTPIA